MEITKLVIGTTLVLALIWIFRRLYKNSGKNHYKRTYDEILNSDKYKTKGQWDR